MELQARRHAVPRPVGSQPAGTGNPLTSFVVYASLMLGGIGFVLAKPLLVGLEEDVSHISKGILIVFLASMTVAAHAALRLSREWSGIVRVAIAAGASPTNARSKAEALARTILEHPARSSLHVKDLIDAYYSTCEAPLRFVTSLAGLLVTLGLIGTILGLIVSVNGLEAMMQSVGQADDGIFGGVKDAIEGMSIAFYSTLFGSILGAVVIRLLAVSLVHSLVKMSCALFQHLELCVRAPAAPAHSVSVIDAAEVESARALALHQRAVALNLASMSKALEGATAQLEAFKAESLDARLIMVQQQLEACATALRGATKRDASAT